MPGPWEKYQTSTGPWSKYQPFSPTMTKVKEIESSDLPLEEAPLLSEANRVAEAGLRGAAVAAVNPAPQALERGAAEVSGNLQNPTLPEKVARGAAGLLSPKQLLIQKMLSIPSLSKVAGATEVPAATTAVEKTPGMLETFANREAAKAMQLTKGSLKHLARNRMSPEEAGRFALDTGIVKSPLTHPLASGIEGQAERAAALKASAGQAVGAAGEKLEAAGIREFNPAEAAVNLKEAAAPYQGLESTKAIESQYEKGIHDILNMGEQGTVPHPKVKQFEKAFKEMGYNEGMPVESKAVAQDVARAVEDANVEAMGRGVQKLGDPKLLSQYLEAKKTYGPASNITRELADRLLSQKGYRHGGGGPVNAVINVIQHTYHPFMATSADFLSRLVKTGSTTLGRYAPVIGEAAKRGPQAIAATHYVLSQQDPDYRARITALEDATNEK